MCFSLLSPHENSPCSYFIGSYFIGSCFIGSLVHWLVARRTDAQIKDRTFDLDAG